MSTTTKFEHNVVSPEEWFRAHSDFLKQEKELTRLSDELGRRRRALPWTRVDKDYVFASVDGPRSLAELFAGRSQLATYHFMFGPDWEEGCPGCSFVTDHLNGTIEHLQARDVNLVLVSRAPLEKLQAFERRMGWRCPWVSSAGCDFNRDFSVSFTAAEAASDEKLYNFRTTAPHGEESPGLSYFYKDSNNALFHTYSTFGRGLETLLGTYAILDRAPQGRNEDDLPSPMSWVRHHDKYEHSPKAGGACCHK